MSGNYKLELITGVAVLVFIACFLYTSAGGSYEFNGSDDAGSQKISELTGNTVESFEPLIPQYQPPGGE
ncbi:MAG: energy-coupling factor ABC transporter substrate-binding protein, partial [Methanobacteriota archaeon]